MPTISAKRKQGARLPPSETQVIGFRLPRPLAKAIKEEAARRELPLNVLMEEFWKLYREAKRAG